MYQQPNENGVYEPEYVFPIKIDKDSVIKISLCQTQSPDGWLFGASFNSKNIGFSDPIMRYGTVPPSWQQAVERAVAGVHVRFIGEDNEKLVRGKITEFSSAIPVLRIDDFKINHQEAKKVAKKTKPQTENPPEGMATPTDPATLVAPAVEAPADKIYFHQWKNGTSIPVSLQKPLTDHGKKLISDAIDETYSVEIIDQQQFEILRNDAPLNVDKPSDEKHAEVCKLIDYEPMIKKTVTCSEYFDDPFSVGEVTQKASEFSEACQRKERLEKELKSHTQYVKSQITEAEATISRLSQDLGRGKTTNHVRCHWIFNEPKRGLKSLYRLDKEPKELVRVDRMTASDKQLTLEDAAALTKKTERTLEEKPITPVTNEPYEGEVMTDKEVEKETGFVVQPEADEPPFTEDDPGAEYCDGPDDCPI